jgi:hypothetical protein
MDAGALVSFFPVGIPVRCTCVLPLINADDHPVVVEVASALLVFSIIHTIFLNVLMAKDFHTTGRPSTRTN